MIAFLDKPGLRPIRLLLAQLRTLLSFNYDTGRLTRATLDFKTSTTPDRRLRDLALDYHVVEKGLSMPQRRLGFGKAKFLRLKQNTLRALDSDIFPNATHLQNAIHALCEYCEIHQKASFDLNDRISPSEYKILRQARSSNRPASLSLTAETFFNQSDAPFSTFARSRHSSRNFIDKIVSKTKIQEAVNLANTAPSVCNRQSCKVHIYQTPALIEKLLSLQNGNRGFGQTIRNLAIVTSKLEYFVGRNERNQPYIDGGIYLMNFLYSLHHYKLGAVALNWAVLPKQDKKLRAIANIPENECVISLIGFGYLVENFRVPASRKRDSNENLEFK